MPYELIFTSAPRGAGIGKSGYCTVAQTKDMTSDITLALEQTGVYHHIAAPGSGSNPVVYSYRMLDISGDTFYVLSQIRDSGLDFTGRSNYLAHHLVFNSREINNLPSPAVILRYWKGWIKDWGNQQPGFWKPTRFTTETNLNQLPKTLGPAQFWKAKTGDAANAAGLMEYGANQPVYWRCNPGEEAEMVQLFAEALQLADPTGQSFIEAWNYTFTTFLQQGDQPEQFVWRGVVPGTPAFQAAQKTGQTPQLLTQVRDPGNARSEYARTGKPQASAVPAKEKPGSPSASSASAKRPALSLKRTLPEGRSTARPKRKRAVNPAPEKSSGRRKLNDPARKWTLFGGIVIGVCILAGLMIGGISLLSSGDKKPTTIASNGGAPKGNGKDGSPPDGSGKGIAGILGKNPDGTNPDGAGKVKPPVTPAPSADPRIYEFISKNRVYLVPTTAGRYEIGRTDLMKRSGPLGAFFNALKEHDQKNGTFSTNKNPPAEFSRASFGIGPKPIELQPTEHIKYDPAGGTVGQPFHYLLGPMTVLTHSQNPAKKDAGIHFHFSDWAQWGQAKRPWIHVAGKSGSGIKPFYLVPLEITQPSVALINLKVGGWIQFETTMTAKAKPEIVSAMKKLLKDNGLGEDIRFWAGPPGNWLSAHKKDKDIIDLKLYMAEKKRSAETSSQNVEKNVQIVETAINKLFPAAQAVVAAQDGVANAQQEVTNAEMKVRMLFRKAEMLANELQIIVIQQQLGINVPKQFFIIFGVKRAHVMEMEITDFETKRFKEGYGKTPVQGGKIKRWQQLQAGFKPFFDAKKDWKVASKGWKNKAATLNEKNAKLKEKYTAAKGISTQLKANRLDPEAIFDAERIVNGKMTLADAKTKWQKNIEIAKKMDWPAEIAKWDDPKHKKAEWNKFKQHPAFYLGATINNTMLPLIQFSK